MNPSVEEGKDLMLRVYAKQIGLEHPSWGKAKCYAQAQSEHPELREEYGPTSGPPTYPYQPAAGSQLDELLERYVKKYRYDPTARKPVVSTPFPEERAKVEADKKDDDDEPMLVYGVATRLFD